MYSGLCELSVHSTDRPFTASYSGECSNRNHCIYWRSRTINGEANFQRCYDCDEAGHVMEISVKLASGASGSHLSCY